MLIVWKGMPSQRIYPSLRTVYRKETEVIALRIQVESRTPLFSPMAAYGAGSRIGQSDYWDSGSLMRCSDFHPPALVFLAVQLHRTLGVCVHKLSLVRGNFRIIVTAYQTLQWPSIITIFWSTYTPV